MEPTAAAEMEGLNIHDGIVDNSAGTTVYAVSLGGWEDANRRAFPLRNSRFHHVEVREGQITVLATESLEISDVTVYASSRGPMANASQPMLYINHENKNLRLNRVDLVRDVGAGTGGLLLVSHGNDMYPSNIAIEGGTWTSRVDPQIKGNAYVAFESTHGVSIRNLALNLEGPTPAKAYGLRFRSSARDVRDIDIQGLRIKSPRGKLAAGIWLAATNSNAIAGVKITRTSAGEAASFGVLFDATEGSTIDRAPVLDANDFAGASAEWTTAHFATNRTFPRIVAPKK
ncbi:MAG: hypothetical protein KF773_01725 [Deltaproteobacteria bacterium]|nr:hypothetical protein [Deltaproteobacteria bacterium]